MPDSHLALAVAGGLSPIVLASPHDRLSHRPTYDKSLCLMVLSAWPTWSGTALAWDTRRPATMLWGKLFDYQPDVVMRAAYPELSPLLSLGLTARRSLYLRTLHRLMDRAAGAPLEVRAALEYEHAEWMAHDRAQMERLIRPRCAVQGYGDTQSHWLWQGPMKYGRPTIDWGGVEDVAVYRILWPHYRPRDLLTDRNRPRRIKLSHSSPGMDLCVNPLHYEYAIPVRPGRSDRTRPFVGDPYVPTPRPLWHYYNAVRDEYGKWVGLNNWYIPCPNSPEHGPMVGATREYLEGKQRGRGYCQACYQNWRLTRPVVDARPYAGSAPPQRTLSQIRDRSERQLAANLEAERIAREVEKAQHVLDTWHRKDEDEDEGGVVYQADENDPWPGPASA